MEEPDEDERLILGKWGSWERVYGRLDEELAELCPLVCGSGAPVPKVQVKPTWLARGLLGERRSGADYEPSEGRSSAEIGVFPAVLGDEGLIRRVLAHELIHHWEHLSAGGDDRLPYPIEADAIISLRFRDPTREQTWRAGHSRAFIAKAGWLANTLGIGLRDLLFS